MTASLELLQLANGDAIVARWQGLFKCKPPPGEHIGLLRNVLAWHAC